MSNIVKYSFHGDVIDCVKTDDTIWVSVRRICEPLGLDRKAQQDKLKDKPWAVGGLIPLTADDGKIYDTFCISLDSLPMWLATIEPARVRADLRPKLEMYQKECAVVLRDHFFGPPSQAAELRALMLRCDALIQAVEAKRARKPVKPRASNPKLRSFLHGREETTAKEVAMALRISREQAGKELTAIRWVSSKLRRGDARVRVYRRGTVARGCGAQRTLPEVF